MVSSFKLKKNSFHMFMMNYIWNFEAKDFTHMCPYFWLSVLNVFIILPVAFVKTTSKLLLLMVKGFIWVFKLAIKAFTAIGDKIEATAKDYNDRNFKLIVEEAQKSPEKAIEKLVRLSEHQFEIISKKLNWTYWEIPEGQANDKYEFLGNLRLARSEQIMATKKAKTDKVKEKWAKKLAKTHKLSQGLVNYDETPHVYKPKKNNKQRINKILKVVTPILKGIIYSITGAVVLFLLFFILKGLIHIVTILYNADYSMSPKKKSQLWEATKLCLKYIGILVVSLTIVIVLFKGIVALVKRIPGPSNRFKYKVGDFFEILAEKIVDGLSFICKCIAWPFVLIGKGCKLIWDFVYSAYKNQCPPIDWE